jgi:membrane protease YdiL (CAAX protease family)
MSTPDQPVPSGSAPMPDGSPGYYEEFAPPPEPVPPRVSVKCWRCGLSIHAETICINCDAQPRHWTTAQQPVAATSPPPRVLGMILAYVLFLMTSLIWAAVLHSKTERSDDFVDDGVVVMEFIDLVFTLSLFICLGRFHVRKPQRTVRLAAWLLAPAVSLGIYWLAHWYVSRLRDYIDAHWLNVEAHWTFSPFYVAVVAVQPAIVEELFFRYFAFGALRQVTNVHSAVFLSALMFALAHLYNPLGLPILFLMGLVLGYARAASGGLLLPMLMHFSHNCAILWFTAAN